MNRAESARRQRRAAAAAGQRSKAPDTAAGARAGRFEQAFLQAPVATALVDLDGVVLNANAAFGNLLGIEAAALGGSSLLRLVHADDRHACESCFASLCAGELQRYDAERRYVGASGAVVFTQESAAVVRGDDGAPECVVVQLQEVTGRREFATALQRNEARLRHLFEQIPALLWTTDKDLRFALGFGRLLDFFNLRSNAPESLFDYFHTSDPDFIAIAAHRRAMSGESVTFEIEWLGRAFRSHLEPLRDGAGEEIVGVIGVASDITELKRMEDALRHSEKKFRSLAETMSAAAFIFQGTSLVYANPAAVAITGFEQDELEKMSFWDVIHPEDREVVRLRGLARQSGHDVPNRYEVRVVSKSGEERWVDYTGGPTEYQGQPAVLGTAFDVTERKRAEAGLRESEERFRAIFERSPLGMAVIDRDQRIVEVNDALCLMLGFTREELRGRSVEEASHPGEIGRNLRDAKRLLEDDAPPLQREQRFLRKNGEEAWLRVTASRIRSAEGVLLHWLAMVEDVTEQRRSEAAAREHRAQLGRVLRLRSMGELAAGLAHELNQPLAAVVSFAKGCVHRLRAGDLRPEDLAEKLDQIADQALRAGSIIHWVQRFLRKEEPRREPTDLPMLVANIVRLVEAEARQRGIEMRLRLPPDLPLIPAEAVQIEQVLFNLVRNGFDAIAEQPSEAAEIEISACRRDGAVVVSVRDTGPGPGLGDPERIFEPFYSSKSAGMGLGLSISRSIIESHGGRLWIGDTTSNGTTFHFTLPIDSPSEE